MTGGKPRVQYCASTDCKISSICVNDHKSLYGPQHVTPLHHPPPTLPSRNNHHGHRLHPREQLPRGDEGTPGAGEEGGAGIKVAGDGGEVDEGLDVPLGEGGLNLLLVGRVLHKDYQGGGGGG